MLQLKLKGTIMEKEIRLIEPFSKINFKDFGTLILSQGETPSLTIEADEAILSELVSKVEDDTLTLGLGEDWINRIGKLISSIFSTNDYKITYWLTVVDLNQISISGKCHLQCDSLTTDKLELKVLGLSDMAFKHLDCNQLHVNISGRGDFVAAGRADRQELRISGSGEIHAPDLYTKSTRIVISGQGNAKVRVEEELDITISGLGQVHYYGQPKLHQVISGLGKSFKVE
jgi:hypothetical protein